MDCVDAILDFDDLFSPLDRFGGCLNPPFLFETILKHPIEITLSQLADIPDILAESLASDPSYPYLIRYRSSIPYLRYHPAIKSFRLHVLYYRSELPTNMSDPTSLHVPILKVDEEHVFAMMQCCHTFMYPLATDWVL